MTKKFVHIFRNILFPRLFYSAILGAVLLSPERGLAQNELPNPLKTDSLTEFLGLVVDVLIRVGIPVAAMFIIYSGFLFVTARGSEEQVRKAKSTFFWAVIGTALLVGAWVVITIVEGTIKELEPS